MTASVCARCDAMVTTESKMPTTPTRIPTRRVFGSAVCSCVISISGMFAKNSSSVEPFAQSTARRGAHGAHVPHGAPGPLFDGVQARIRARDSEDAAAYDLDNFAECSDAGNELADLDFRAGQFHDETRRVGGQHLAADAAQQSAHRVDVFGCDLQFYQQ